MQNPSARKEARKASLPPGSSKVSKTNRHEGQEMQEGGSRSQAPVDSGSASGSATAAAEEPAKRRRVSGGNEWLRSWAWKREHRPDKVRFDRPYLHSMRLPGSGEQEVKLTVHQARFKEQGFASTVWDSSIVLAKLFEKHPARFAGRRCLDLSAGCGLPGLVLCKLGAAAVVSTDLGPNLALLRKNGDVNGCSLQVEEHSWGEPAEHLQPPFDVIAACDVMYIAEAVAPLVASLVALSGPQTEIYIAHGRNRGAEPQFLEAAAPHFSIETVSSEELDEVYQCTDVDVVRLRPLAGKAAAMEQQGRKERRMEDPAALERAAKRLLAAAPRGAPPAAAAVGQALVGGALGKLQAQHPQLRVFRQPLSAAPWDAQQPAAAPAAARLPLPPAHLIVPPPAGLPQPIGLLGLQPKRHAAALQANPPHADPLFFRYRSMACTPAARPGHALPQRPVPLAAANGRRLPPSPGWPVCSPERARAASEDASSPKGQALHVLAADVREAVSGGLSGRVSKSLESLLFISSGASINAALATRNRKTVLDIEEPSPVVRALVQAFEVLRGELAASGGDGRAEMMQQAWSAVLGRVLKPAAGSVQTQLRRLMAGLPAYGKGQLHAARQALCAAADKAEAALAGCSASGPDAAPLAALEAMQRFAVRTILPVAPSGGLHAFPWLERAVWELFPALRPTVLPYGDIWPAFHGGPALELALAHLVDVADVLEDAAGGTPELERQAACRGIMQAAGAAVLGAHLRPDAETALRSLRCLEPLGPGAVHVRPTAERAVAASAALRGTPHQLAAAAELLERAARVMRLAPWGWAAVMWTLLGALQLNG